MKEKIKAREHFSARAEKYSGGCFSDETHLDMLIEAAEVNHWFKVLDIACGRGFLLERLSSRVRLAVGIDISEGMLQGSFRNCLLGDAEALPFRDSSFNAAFTRFSFHHFPEPERALREIARVLSEGGTFILADGVSSERQECSEYLNSLEKLRDSSHVNLYPESELLSMLEEEGFEVLDVRYHTLKQSLREWLDRASCSTEIKEKLKEAMEGELIRNKTGLKFWREEGEIFFSYDTVIIKAKK